MRIVLDTNVLLSGAFFGGNPARVVDACVQGALQLLLSPEILDEYRRAGAIFAQQKPSSGFQELLAALVAGAVVVLPGQLLYPACRDPDDDKFIRCAIAGHADCIVSGDKDLLSMKEILSIPVLSPGGFVRRYLAKQT